MTGDAIIQATVTDDSGNSSSANSEIFIPGNEREWFAGRDDDRLDFLPEKPAYEPGDVARFQVRMPFAEATALVTVEREGVLAASIVHLSGRDPVITLPVRDWAPNVFVSALVVRGRIAGVQPTAMVDLGKPAFKLGIAGIRVGWRDHRLNVKVAPEKSVYHVRDKALVKISVRTFDGKAPAPGSAIAVAAVDEGLLELRANDSWKLLDAMMGQRAYQVETSAAEMQIVGKRHFGIKAIPPGGGGGHQITRELFDTLLLWKASVALDSNGDATVEVPLNDSLTSFRIVAIADSGPDQFGTGFASIRSTQDLMLLSGVSPIIRNGDSFAAEFTVRNASERAFDATVNAKIDGLAQVTAAAKARARTGPGHDHFLECRSACCGAGTQVSRRCERRARTVRSFADHAARDTRGPGSRASGHARATRETSRPAGRAPGRRTRRRRRRAGFAQSIACRRTRRRARLDAPISVRMPRTARVGGSCAGRSETLERNRCRLAVVYRLRRIAQVLSRYD